MLSWQLPPLASNQTDADVIVDTYIINYNRIGNEATMTTSRDPRIAIGGLDLGQMYQFRVSANYSLPVLLSTEGTLNLTTMREFFKIYSEEVECPKGRLGVLGGGWVYSEEIRGDWVYSEEGVLRGGWVYSGEVGVLGGGWVNSEEVGSTRGRLGVLRGGWVYSEEIRGDWVYSEEGVLRGGWVYLEEVGEGG